MSLRPLVLLFSLLALSACATTHEPSGLDASKRALTRYEQSGDYMRDIARVDGQAQAFVVRYADTVKKPALILDIDETSLSNWPELKANDFAFLTGGPCDHLPQGPCGIHAWDAKGIDKAIPPTLALFRAARAHHVTVFFLTGRDDSLRAATEKNLRAVGYRGYAGLIMRPHGKRTKYAADYKAPRRAWIESKGYTILATVGDQESDLDGGHAMRGFKLPNPFYTIP